MEHGRREGVSLCVCWGGGNMSGSARHPVCPGRTDRPTDRPAWVGMRAGGPAGKDAGPQQKRRCSRAHRLIRWFEQTKGIRLWGRSEQGVGSGFGPGAGQGLPDRSVPWTGASPPAPCRWIPCIPSVLGLVGCGPACLWSGGLGRPPSPPPTGHSPPAVPYSSRMDSSMRMAVAALGRATGLALQQSVMSRSILQRQPGGRG